ncbi:MAG: HesA/MoeB/ThiF family protein, partial [Bacteroidota bacterium]
DRIRITGKCDYKKRGYRMTSSYDRQRNLNIHVPNSICVVGCGGVGSWVAILLALVGVKRMELWDGDIVEETNLNRTLFSPRDVGRNKAQALGEIILRLRPRIQLSINTRYLQPEDVKSLRAEVIVDGRDVFYPPLPNVRVSGGYNGKSLTLHLNPSYTGLEGATEEDAERRGYLIVPSYVVPPVLLASLFVGFICNPTTSEERISTFEVEDIINLLSRRLS